MNKQTSPFLLRALAISLLQSCDLSLGLSYWTLLQHLAWRLYFLQTVSSDYASERSQAVCIQLSSLVLCCISVAHCRNGFGNLFHVIVHASVQWDFADP